MDTNTKHFQIHTIVSLGCKGLELCREDEDRDKHQIELVSFMLGKEQVSKFYLEYIRASISGEINRQFPDISFAKIKARAKKVFNRVFDPKSLTYKLFIEWLENSYGKTLAVKTVGQSFIYPPPHFYTTGTTPESYICAICKASNVKLWRPWADTEPFICASCAEKHQAQHEYDVIERWEPHKKGWRGIYAYEDAEKTKIKRLPMEKWIIDDKGKVPSYIGSPGPDGVWGPMTDQLSLNLKGIFKNYSSGSTCMMPAIPDTDGSMWGYTSVPEEGCNWWDNLPTHKTE